MADAVAAENVAAPEIAAETTAATAAPTATAAPAKAKPSHGGYHYFHQHIRDIRASGDVAPIAVPVCVKTEAAVATPLTPSLPLDTYSWCNNATSVSVYVDFPGVAAETGAATVNVSFEPRRLRVSVTPAPTADGAAAVERVLLLRLAKEIDPAKSSHRLKPNQVVVRLAKGDATATWYDLVDNKIANDDE